METSVLTIKGQLLIPKRIRNKYGITSGVKVAFIEAEDGLILKPMDEAYFNHFAGMLKDMAPSREELKAWKEEDKFKEEKKMIKNFKHASKRAK
jgi:AbrB family looped-hinge helix DNA binding protein